MGPEPLPSTGFDPRTTQPAASSLYRLNYSGKREMITYEANLQV